MKKKVLIVGGTGFIGYHLIKNFKKKYEIISLSVNKNTQNKIKGIKYIFFDFTKKKNLKILDNYFFDYVINLGGYVDHFNKKKTTDNQYLGVKNLLNYLIKKQIKSFIQIGSSAEYGITKSPQREKSKCKPKLIYGKAKFQATKYVQKISRKKLVTGIILRLYQVYGPMQPNNRFLPTVINKCLNNKNYLCHEKGVCRDFLYIDDFIVLINRILNKKKINNYAGQIFNVGFGKPIDLNIVAKKIELECKGGKQLKKKAKLRIDEPKVIFPDISRVKKVFNWKPKVTFKIGLRKTIEYYRNV